MVKKVEFFEYDIKPTENKEIVTTFKVDGKPCEMKIPYKTIQNMLRLIELETLCLNCKREEKDPVLGVCETCYDKRIWDVD